MLLRARCMQVQSVAWFHLRHTMLESLVATILNRFLGNYVSNLNYDQLNIGVWKGMREMPFNMVSFALFVIGPSLTIASF